VSVRHSLAFCGRLLRDLVGTLRQRWLRFCARVVEGRDVVTVGVDVFPFCEHKTGVGWYEWNLLTALERGADGLTFNLYAHTFYAASEQPLAEVPGNQRLRLRVHQLPVGFVLPQAATVKLLRWLVEPLLRTLDANDVLFAPNFFLHPTQLPYGRAVVATVHDLAFKAMPETVAPATLRELELNLGTTLFRCERLIAVSDRTAEDIVEYLGASRWRVHTIHEGVDPHFADGDEDQEHPELELPERYLLFVSTLEPRKNIMGILTAFRLLVEWGYTGKLVLVGRWGWRTEVIRRALEQSPVREHIMHWEYLERRLLPTLYRHCDALLFPSWMEGFGLPLLEAMACGAPVVTSGTSAMPEVAGTAAVYVDPAHPQGIASAVDALLSDSHHRQRLVELGRKRAASFSWDRAALATTQVLRQAAGLAPSSDDEFRV